MILTSEQIAQERASAVAIARAWMPTPWRHQEHVRGSGVDCAMFPLAVLHEAGVIERMPTIVKENFTGEVGPDEINDYTPQWALHRDDDRYEKLVLRYAVRLPEGTPLLPGDFVLYRMGRSFGHGAIVIKWPLVIHSVMQHGVMLADGENEGELTGRPRRDYRVRRWVEAE